MATAVRYEDDEIADANVRSARQILLQAVILGLMADNVFRTAPGGIAWLSWIAALSGAAVLVARYRGERLNVESRVWLLVAVGCAGLVALRAAEALQFVNTVATLVALALCSAAVSGRPVVSIFVARIRDVLAALIHAAIDGLTGAARLGYRDADLAATIRSTAATRWPWVRAMLLTLPLFVAFTALLSRADPIFGSIFRLPELRVDVMAEHIALGGVFAWLSAGWMRGAFLTSGGRSSLPQRLPFELSRLEVTMALGTVLVLFAIFVAIQLGWLFGGANVVQATTGLTVAEYARRGFFELVMVAALVFPLVLGTRAALTDPASLQRHTKLALALLGLLAAIITSAVLRMHLYVTSYGLTTDRLFALAFMIWLTVVFAAMAATLLRGWAKPFAAMTVGSAFIALLGLNILNPELVVARVNLSRVPAAAGTDYEYLTRLSADAVPVVAAALSKAAASPNACNAAKILRTSYVGGEIKKLNFAQKRAREAVLADVPVSRLQHLCLVKAAA
jgi:uncharacterized integral membrane protein